MAPVIPPPLQIRSVARPHGTGYGVPFPSLTAPEPGVWASAALRAGGGLKCRADFVDVLCGAAATSSGQAPRIDNLG